MQILSDMEKPNVPCETHDLTFFDGTTRRVYTTDAEYHLSHTAMIFSRTDAQGFITQVNMMFIETSGWTREELIGKPHYILRHPHMPKAAFADMWASVQKGETWTGFVKNLRKNGGFYWVKAVVTPIYDRDGKIEGYNSVRRYVTQEEARHYDALYAVMRQEEQNG